jgi:hypothetical protein
MTVTVSLAIPIFAICARQYGNARRCGIVAGIKNRRARIAWRQNELVKSKRYATGDPIIHKGAADEIISASYRVACRCGPSVGVYVVVGLVHRAGMGCGKSWICRRCQFYFSEGEWNMSASRYKDRHETEQEETEMSQRQAHADGICEGIPLCGYCLDDWEEQQRDELDRQGYYK